MEAITIYLGSKCNLNCSYCHREADLDEMGISDKILKYVKGRDDIRIKFMGGEPTLYMDEIKKVVAVAPNAQYAISTNGIDIEKYLEFFEKYKFLVCISFDGAEDDLRGFDPFTNFLQYPYLAVSCTLYHGNTDFKKILKRFADKEKIIGRPLSFFPHLMHVTGEHNKEFGLTKADCDSILKQYKECIEEYMDGLRRWGMGNRRYTGLLKGLLDRSEIHYEFGETYCVNKKLKKMDTKGDLYPCLYIRRNKLSDNWLEEMKGLIPEACQKCTVYGMCGGGCLLSQARDIECYFYFNLYSWWKGGYDEYLRLSECSKEKRQGENQTKSRSRGY